MMSEETRKVLRAILGRAFAAAADFLEGEAMDIPAEVLFKVTPSLVERLLDELIDESVVLDLGKDATASGDVTF